MARKLGSLLSSGSVSLPVGVSELHPLNAVCITIPIMIVNMFFMLSVSASLTAMLSWGPNRVSLVQVLAAIERVHALFL